MPKALADSENSSAGSKVSRNARKVCLNAVMICAWTSSDFSTESIGTAKTLVMPALIGSDKKYRRRTDIKEEFLRILANFNGQKLITADRIVVTNHLVKHSKDYQYRL